MLSEGQHLLVDRTKNDLSKSWCSHLQYSFANSTTSSRSCSDLRSSISKIVACASIERVDVRLDDILAFKLSVIFTTVDSASITSTDNKKRNSRTHSSAIIVFIPPPPGRPTILCASKWPPYHRKRPLGSNLLHTFRVILFCSWKKNCFGGYSQKGNSYL